MHVRTLYLGSEIHIVCAIDKEENAHTIRRARLRQRVLWKSTSLPVSFLAQVIQVFSIKSDRLFHKKYGSDLSSLLDGKYPYRRLIEGVWVQPLRHGTSIPDERHTLSKFTRPNRRVGHPHTPGERSLGSGGTWLNIGITSSTDRPLRPMLASSANQGV